MQRYTSPALLIIVGGGSVEGLKPRHDYPSAW
jgi:hypothetical protein